MLGEQVWRDSGLGAPGEVEELTARIAVLEQENADLNLTVRARAGELDAARDLNRELTKALNQPGLAGRPVRP